MTKPAHLRLDRDEAVAAPSVETFGEPGADASYQWTWHFLDLPPLLRALADSRRIGLAGEPDLRLLAIVTSSGTFVLDGQLIPRSKDLQRMLGQPLVVGHRLARLLPELEARGCRIERFYDVAIAERLLLFGVGDGTAIDVEPMARRYKIRVRSPGGAAEWARLVLAIADAQASIVERLNMGSVLDLEHEVLPEVLAMQQTGLRFDRERWITLMQRRRAAAAALQSRICEALGIRSLGERDLRHGLGRCGISVPDVKRTTLLGSAHNPIVADILAYYKLRGFIDSIRQPIDAALQARPDDRVRGRWDQLGCATGRMTCATPNLLGIPRDPEVRACVVPDLGHLFVDADYSHADLRVIAELTGDPNLRAAFAGGRDPHAETAARMLGKSLEDVTEEERKKAKPVNFGCVYSMGPGGLRDYAHDEYGVDLTVQEAETAIEAFRSAYPGVRAWQEANAREERSTTRTLLGRIRSLAGRNRNAVRLASPIQGSVADILKIALAKVGRAVRPLGGRPVLAVHDQIVVEVPEARAIECKSVVEREMLAAMSAVLKEVPPKAKVEVKRNWAGT